ncbi:MAG: peptidoglycan editing factor PgeF [Thermonemataceae bacterium]|nr:peptidoglycan editing factor PgeF [Thermonemataceae bacterium]
MLLYFPKLSAYPQILHFVSTRQKGFSKPPYDSLNLGFGTEDDPNNVLKNRELLAQTINVPLENWCVPQQTHSDNIAILTAKHKGKGTKDKKSAIGDTDAVITNQKNVLLFVQSADCVCSLFYDTHKQVIAACHAGWRGTVAHLPQKVVGQMIKVFGSEAEHIKVALGACISKEIYEVGQEVVEAVEKKFENKKHLIWNETTKKYHFDLHSAHIEQLEKIGIKSENIERQDFCTYQNPALFFSARRDKNLTGRFGAGIMLV